MIFVFMIQISAMKVITFLFVFSLVQAYGQDKLLNVLPLVDSKVVYRHVHEVASDDKLELQHKAQTWFRDSHIPIHENKPLDDAHQQIVGEHSIKALWGPNQFDELKKTVEFKIELILKKDRYQYKFSNFVVKDRNKAIQLEIYQMDQRKLQKYNRDFYNRIDEEIKVLILSLTEAMSAIEQ